MLRRGTGVLVLILLVSITSAEAGTKFEIQPYGTMRLGSTFGEGYYENNILEDLDVASGGGFGVSLGVPVGPQSQSGQLAQIELSFSYQKSDLRFQPNSMEAVPDSIRERFEADGDYLLLGELEVMYVHIGGLYQFGDFSGWLPFVNGGLGASVFSATEGEADSESKFSLSLGAGLARMFNERIGARLHIRSYFTSLPADEAYWVDPWGGVWEITDNNWFVQPEVSLGFIIKF